ncbi:7-alpha-hydroxycholest-4-en-3-one 12-alpha-hydroxylase [Lamellibrachia satsuma]|nr:7-alpha-hydroxycholest-4-en-3-one 12-alpha-hydroxylase [Lamellibrachia satsuma]
MNSQPPHRYTELVDANVESRLTIGSTFVGKHRLPVGDEKCEAFRISSSRTRVPNWANEPPTSGWQQMGRIEQVDHRPLQPMSKPINARLRGTDLPPKHRRRLASPLRIPGAPSFANCGPIPAAHVQPTELGDSAPQGLHYSHRPSLRIATYQTEPARMLTAVILICIATILSIILMFAASIFRKRRPGEPPIVAGSLLWGSAVDFSLHAVNFLHKCRSVYGEVFTLRLINQYITIVMDPHSVEALSKERNFDFDPIQKQVNWNVFSFSLVEPKKMIKDTGRTVRGAHMKRGMTSYVDNLNIACDDMHPDNNNVTDEWKGEGLRDFAAKTIFDALFNSIFGREKASSEFSAQKVYENFEVFHEYFNYLWLGVPKKCFPAAMKALGGLLAQPSADELLGRHDSCDYMKNAIEHMRLHGQTDADIKGHNLVYLHVNYNTFRLAFWAINHVLEDPKAHEALLAELKEAVESRVDSNNVATFSLKEIEKLQILDSVVNETCRMASGVFMVRYINEDTQFEDSNGNTHLMRQGDRVAIYPPAIHKDPEIFEKPTEFIYDRFIDATFYKNGKILKNPLLAFGTLCPGKRYALLQLKWYLLTVFTRFDMRLQPGASAKYDYRYHGHEVLPPVEDVNIDFRPLSEFARLNFSCE